MSWAVDERDNPVKLAEGARAICTTCRGVLRAHCGDVLTWHWHHEGADCDPWYEPETAWHQSWKSEFPEEWREVTRAPHRADVITTRGLVIEFQHSSLSYSDYEKREQFWGGLVWVFDARDWFFPNFDIRMRPDKLTFRWKQPRQSMFGIQRPLFLDTGKEIFEITFLGRKIPCGGVGRFIPYRTFLWFMKWADPHTPTKVDPG